MDSEQLAALKQKLETADVLDDALANEAHAVMASDLTDKIDEVDALTSLTSSAEDAIKVIGHIHPGWALTLDGYASSRDNARWRCTLRESRGPDDDQIVGIGNANTIRLAILAAVAHIKMMRAAGYR